jgi:hypothetical protein
MPMAPGLKQLLDIDFARKAYVTYDYLAWKLRCYNEFCIFPIKGLTSSKVSTEAEQAINELFLIMIDSETAKYPIPKWKRYLIERLIKNLNGGALKHRDGDNDRMA